MLYYLLRFVVNAVAIALTAWLLPGITVVGDSLWTYLWLALGLALINALIRPVVLLFTGQMIIATMGLLILVINGLMFWLLAYFFPNEIQVRGFFSVLLAGALIAIIATALETILGLTQPIGLTKKGAPTNWHGLDLIAYGGSKRIMENLRLQQIYQTFFQYGLDIAIERSPIAGFQRWMQTRVYRDPGVAGLSIPAKVRLMLQELGPVYVKMGQIVSSQAQALPEDWQQELAKLQSSVPPFPAEEAREIITTELGKPPAELFADFEAESFAAASTAQVHRATLPSGERVVVKVQRPNILPQVQADLGIMQSEQSPRR